MAVKIRLMRIGAKKRPFYRVVAVDEQRKRTGGYIELLGTYNPLTEPKEIILKKERIAYWLEHGAVPSDGYLRITGAAPQKPPRKPKKAQGTQSTAVGETTEKKETPAAEQTAPVEEEQIEIATEEKQEQPVEAQQEETPTTENAAEAPVEEKKEEA